MSWLKGRRHSSISSTSNPTPVDTSKPTPRNELLFQTFEWHTSSNPPAPHETRSEHSHYAQILRTLPFLAKSGVTSIWLPPGCKANNPQGNGYDCYDLWDLGEFDQKYTRATKWGSREELADVMNKAKELGIEVVWDAVLNHKTAGDATDECWAVEVAGEDRRFEICHPKKIEAWLKYDFPGRGDKYSSFKWHADHFNGTDWDQRGEKNAIFKIIDDPATHPKPGRKLSTGPVAPVAMSGMNRLAKLANKFTNEVGSGHSQPPRRPGKGWAEDVDDMHGNYDYLMFSNVDYKHPEVRQDVLNWGQWMVDSVGVDGFRLDAVQHFSYAFTRDWIAHVQRVSQQCRGKKSFIVGEIWTGEVERILKWLRVVSSQTQPVYAYDSPLLYNFSRISQDVVTGSKNSDLRTILRDSLLMHRPHQAVTLVTNHDTQPGQASAVPMDSTLKSLFYAFILLRKEGLPCVFWGDMYGTRGPLAEPPACPSASGAGTIIADLMLARAGYAYGEQRDYPDAANCIGFTRAGTHDRPGCAVVLSIQNKKLASTRKMPVGRPGEVWRDLLGNMEDVTIDKKGFGAFTCQGMSVSVFVKKD